MRPISSPSLAKSALRMDGVIWIPTGVSLGAGAVSRAGSRRTPP
jgi:hypothetical protein